MGSKEEFRVFDLHTSYSISSNGRVLNIKTGKLLNPKTGRYLRVPLWIDGKQKMFSIHRLVAYAFLGLNIFDSEVLVLHKDDNKHNNNIENLKLGTPQDNTNDAFINGKFNISSGDSHYRTKVSQSQYEEIKLLYSKGGIAQRRIGEIYGVGQCVISRIINGKTKKKSTR